MTTRGGVSKAQKVLHLNEDVFADMNAFGRGGRIKHTEYNQCGKGRGLRFGTILNFRTKLGNGMGEQMLSCEYYYMAPNFLLIVSLHFTTDILGSTSIKFLSFFQYRFSW
jgi:hypothetical protein